MDFDFEKSNFFQYYHTRAGLTAEQFAELAPYYKFREVPIEQFLLREGEVCDQVFFVEKGLIAMTALTKAGKEHFIHFAPENWILSDRSSTYFNEPSRYYIKTIEPSTIVYMAPEFTERASELSGHFSRFIERSLQRHIYFQQRRIYSLQAMSAKERYLSFVKTYPDLLLRAPQWMIASYLGITPESLSRVRREVLKERS